MREHEEFIWLHDRYVENEDYAGIVVSKQISYLTAKLDLYSLVDKLCLKLSYKNMLACWHKRGGKLYGSEVFDVNSEYLYLIKF